MTHVSTIEKAEGAGERPTHRSQLLCFFTMGAGIRTLEHLFSHHLPPTHHTTVATLIALSTRTHTHTDTRFVNPYTIATLHPPCPPTIISQRFLLTYTRAHTRSKNRLHTHTPNSDAYVVLGVMMVISLALWCCVRVWGPPFFPLVIVFNSGLPVLCGCFYAHSFWTRGGQQRRANCPPESENR